MESNSKTVQGLSGGLFIGLGLIVVGVMIYCAAVSFKNAERRVSVRGLSEREVLADMVLWPVVYTQTGNDLQTIYSELEAKNKIVLDFLTQAGVANEEITVNSAMIVDLEAERYNANSKGFRYLATQIIAVNSSNVSKVVELQRQQNKLLRSNIALSNDRYQYDTQFLFTKLNDIKPEMIAEATRAAREGAQKFATDSRSKIGKILKATQGQFSINDRDQYTPQIKKVRVVTYVEYALN